MAKLPFMQFFPADYLRDTRCLSMASRGAWMDILCALWHAPKRGIRSLTLEGWAGELGKPSSEVSLYLLDLKENGIGKFIYKKDEKICIISRRMVRDERVRKCAAKRQQKQRKEAESRQESRPGHSDVTGIYQKSEVIDHTSEVIEEKKEKRKAPLRATTQVDREFFDSLKTNPAYQHINMEIENGKMDAWFALPKNKHRVKTRQFVLNWLNKVEQPLQINGTSNPKCQERVQRGTFLKPCNEPSVTVMGGRPLCQQHKEYHERKSHPVTA